MNEHCIEINLHQTAFQFVHAVTTGGLYVALGNLIK
jgi:hypothetical protein